MKRLIPPILILISINLNGQIDTLNQSVISNSGETFESNNYIVNFTIGEVVTETLDNNDKILSQGFHQPNEEMVTSVKVLKGFGEEIRLYPNPTSNEIKLEFHLPQSEKVEISFFEITGKQLKAEIHTAFSELIHYDIRDYSSGQYLLVITSLDKEKQQSYKIIKQ